MKYEQAEEEKRRICVFLEKKKLQFWIVIYWKKIHIFYSIVHTGSHIKPILIFFFKKTHIKQNENEKLIIIKENQLRAEMNKLIQIMLINWHLKMQMKSIDKLLKSYIDMYVYLFHRV